MPTQKQKSASEVENDLGKPVNWKH